MTLAGNIGASLILKLARRIAREGKIKRKAYQEGHEAGCKIGFEEGYARAKKEME